MARSPFSSTLQAPTKCAERPPAGRAEMRAMNSLAGPTNQVVCWIASGV
jgi:hypothetical protein